MLSEQEQCDLFLDTLFGGYPDEGLSVEFRLMRNGQVRQLWHIIREHRIALESLPSGWDVYVGVLPESHDRADYSRFPYANWLWADFDLKVATEDKIKIACENAEMVVASGGGFHAYWRLSETAVFGQNADPEQFQRALKRFQQNLLPGCDPVHDLARILRVPGTTNHKRGEPVRLVRCPGMERVW